jgi:hypothetical protein
LQFFGIQHSGNGFLEGEFWKMSKGILPLHSGLRTKILEAQTGSYRVFKEVIGLHFQIRIHADAGGGASSTIISLLLVFIVCVYGTGN